jgi:hypothetical protein
MEGDAMRRTASILGSLLALTAACASSTASSGTAAKSQSSGTTVTADKTPHEESKLICEMERPVGSNIPKRVCRSQAQIDKERAQAQDQMREATRPGPKNLQ